MMKAIAEFIMRGRWQAALLMVIGLPILSNAALALVTLRRGVLEGLWLFVLALGLTFAVWTMGLVTVPEMIVYAGLMATIFAASLVLRVTVRWLPTLWVLMGASVVVSLSIFYGIPDVAKALNATLENFIEEFRKEAAKQGGDQAQLELLELSSRSPSTWAAILAYGFAVISVLSLCLARYWQALLYNPGGFREEFLQLRLNQMQSLMCLGLAALCFTKPEWQQWSALALLPLVVSGIAMAHQFAKAQGLGKVWLVVFYLALVLVPPFRLGVALLSFADSWVDIRTRLMTNKTMANKTSKRKDDEDKS